VFPVIYKTLQAGQPQFADNPEQKLRNVLLEIINRLPNNEFLRGCVSPILKMSLQLLDIENEENALICLRIIIDMHKNFRPNLESEVQPFLDIVQKLFNELPKTVANTFKGTLIQVQLCTLRFTCCF
jgi:transformation/transcription domain-associated protein